MFNTILLVLGVLLITVIVSWEFLPFAPLILLTALQSLDVEQIEAAEIDGANAIKRFFYIVLPHLVRSITVVILIQSIFLLSVFAEIYVTINGGPGTASTNIPYMIYSQSLLQFDIGGGLRRRNYFCHFGQYCCRLYDADGWQESGGIAYGTQHYSCA